MSTAPCISASDDQQSSSPLRVREVDYRNDPRWLEYLSCHCDALVYHHPGWLAALEEEYGRKCVALACEDAAGRFQGILPLAPTRGLPLRFSRNRTGRRLSSLPRTPLAGPLASSNDALTALLRAAVDLVRGQPGTQLELKTTLADLDQLLPDLECVRWRDTFTRGLPTNEPPSLERIGPQRRIVRDCLSCEDCRLLSFGNARDNHQVRWATKKARKQGLSMREALGEAELRKWYRLYLRVMRRNAVPPRSFRFFRALWKYMQPPGNMELVLAQHCPNAGLPTSDAEPALPASDCSATVGGSILLQFGHTVFWAFTGSEEERFALHANDLTLWSAIHASCKEGYNYFDLGEVAEAHPELTQFKSKWGTIRQPMYRYYFPRRSPAEQTETEARTASSLFMSSAESIWRRLPLPVVAVLGDVIFSFL